MKNHDKKRLTRAQKISLSNGRRKAPEVSLPPMRDFGDRAESGYFGRSLRPKIDFGDQEALFEDPGLSSKVRDPFPEARDD